MPIQLIHSITKASRGCADVESGAQALRTMGFVTQFFIKPRKTALVEFPKGSFTVDGRGKVLTSTLPRKFVTEHVQAIASAVLAAQKAARVSQSPLTELVVCFEGLKLVARDMRGGAIVFLERQSEIVQPPHSAKVG